jgi:4-hydroxyphenylpyruvate dioxygenase-like putative hemolysin
MYSFIENTTKVNDEFVEKLKKLNIMVDHNYKGQRKSLFKDCYKINKKGDKWSQK